MKNMFLSRKEKKKEEAAPQGGGISRALGKVSFEGFDWWLFTLMLIILAIGLIMVLSASGIVAEQVNGDKYYFFKRQLIFACGGGLVLWGAALMPRSWLYKLQYPAIFLSLFLLLLTLSPLTPSINGAKRWIPLGPVNLQPMEFVKISLALYLAYFMSSKQALVKTFSRGVIPPFAVTGLFCGLLLLQPDFGSAVVVASILFFMCLAGGTRFIYLFFAMILACAGAMALAILEPYRLRRLLAFLDPFADPTDTGYHLVQSLLAIGSGGLGRQPTEDVLSARSPQRLHHGRAGRGAGLCGHHRGHAAVRPAVLALLPHHHAPDRTARPADGLWPDGHPGHGCRHESGRGHGGGAAQGRAHAPDELRRQ